MAVKSMTEKAEDFFESNEPTVRWTAKASVFTDLFSRIEYTFQLYQALHPDDTGATEDGLTIMTLESLLLNQQYNDLGFMIGDRLIILVEHQSTWSENIVVRVLMYVIETWHKYIKQTGQDVYGTEKIKLPKPELYVIYTGPDPDSKPDMLSLKESLFNGTDVYVECKVRIITDGRKGDIINQYVRFCQVLNSQTRLYGRTLKAVEETIRICQKEDVLKEYLERQREEVIDMMLTLFDKETIMRNHDACVERRGIAKGRAEGRMEEAIKIYHEEMRMSPEEIVEKLMKKNEMTKEEAAKNVERVLGLQIV